MGSPNYKEQLMDIMQYWDALTAIGLLIAYVAWNRSQINTMKEDIRELKEDRKAFMNCISDINKNISDIRADVSEVKGFLKGKEYHEQSK